MLLPRLLDDARNWLAVPRIALRYRLQNDTHGLDRSRHRILGEAREVGGRRPDDWRVILELDHHGRVDPQVLGAVLAAAALAPSPRLVALRAVEDALAHPRLPEGVT